jgi:hypothetical protein
MFILFFLGHLLLSITPILGNGLQWLRTSSSLPQFDWQTSRPSSFERDTHSGKEFHALQGLYNLHFDNGICNGDISILKWGNGIV